MSSLHADNQQLNSKNCPGGKNTQQTPSEKLLACEHTCGLDVTDALGSGVIWSQ